MKSYSIGCLTGLLKPKYRVISAILGEDFNPTNGLDVFIDLNTLILATASSRKFQNSLPFAEDVEEDMIYSILMILKHWKDYTKKWTDVKIYLFMNSFDITPIHERDVLKSYCVPWVQKFENDRFKQTVYYWNETIKRLSIVLKYIPNSYIINCNRCDSYIIPNIVSDYDSEDNNRQRIILSGNSLMTNYHYMKNTYIIYTRYKFDGMCQVSDPVSIVHSITKVEDDILSTFVKNKAFYNILGAIVGDFDRGILGLTQLGITKFATTLLRSVEKREIPNDPKSIDTVLPVIEPMYHDYLKQVYPLIDIESHTKMIPKSLIEKIRSELVDMYDIDGLHSLNVKGLNLLELL